MNEKWEKVGLLVAELRVHLLTHKCDRCEVLLTRFMERTTAWLDDTNPPKPETKAAKPEPKGQVDETPKDWDIFS